MGHHELCKWGNLQGSPWRSGSRVERSSSGAKPRLEIVEVLLPPHSSGRHGDRPLHGLDSGAVARLRVLLVSHTVSLTQSVMSDGEVAPPAGVGRVERGEALKDGEGFTERSQRLVQLALRLQDVADPVMSDGEVALPAGVGRVERGEALKDGEGFTERGQRLVQVALRLQDVADPVMSDGEVALPAGVGRVERGEALKDGEGFTERGQ